MPGPGEDGKELQHVLIYKEDREEAERLYGKNVSFAKRYHEQIETEKRERLVEKIRRKLLGGSYNLNDNRPESGAEDPPRAV